jgi:predicted aconitase with swiveling domain
MSREPQAQPEQSQGVTVAAPIVLRGRTVYGGRAEGEALVTRQTIPGWGGVNPMLGVITETQHELRGQSFKDKILVCRGAKGSSGWSAMYHTTRLAGTAPKAVVFNEMTTKIALGVIVMRVPSVTDLDRDPLDVIETGDWVIVDGDRGTVEVIKGKAR